MDSRSVHPETLAGDGFAYAGSRVEEDRPHGCIDGWLFIGHMVEDEHGEEVEEIERVPCRRCSKDG